MTSQDKKIEKAFIQYVTENLTVESYKERYQYDTLDQALEIAKRNSAFGGWDKMVIENINGLNIPKSLTEGKFSMDFIIVEKDDKFILMEMPLSEYNKMETFICNQL